MARILKPQFRPTKYIYYHPKDSCPLHTPPLPNCKNCELKTTRTASRIKSDKSWLHELSCQLSMQRSDYLVYPNHHQYTTYILTFNTVALGHILYLLSSALQKIIILVADNKLRKKEKIILFWLSPGLFVIICILFIVLTIFEQNREVFSSYTNVMAKLILFLALGLGIGSKPLTV